VLAHSGYDAVTVDVQHGRFGVTEAVRGLQAVSTSDATPLVQWRSNDAADAGGVGPPAAHPARNGGGPEIVRRGGTADRRGHRWGARP
jgi:hypothetical protein